MGLEPNHKGDFPAIAPTAFVHDTATLIGHVSIGGGCFIGPHAVLRADEHGPDGTVEPIIVGEEANVQDCVVIHALGGTAVKIGPRSAIAHAAIIHGPCEIGTGCFVGFGAVVFKATLGNGVMVMHRALVEGVAVPSGLCVPSMAVVNSQQHVRSLAPATPEMASFAKEVVQTNKSLAEAGLKMRTRGV